MTDTSDQTSGTEATPGTDIPEASGIQKENKLSLEKEEAREDISPDHEGDKPAEKEENREPDVAPPQETESVAVHNAGRFDACFNSFSRIGPLVLLAALLCMAWPIFYQPGLGVYCPAELKSLTAFLHCLADGSWLAPTGLAGNDFTAAQWPAYSWVIGLLALSPGLVESGYLLPTASFLCTFFAVLGVWCLSHAAGFGYKAAFAAGLILLCTPLFAPLPHFVGPAALAAAFMLFALVFFCRGWRGHVSWFSLPVAFIFTALAGLAGGFLPFLVPLGASIIYLIWRANVRRANSGDAIFGFIIMLAIFGAWLGTIMLRHVDDSYLGLLFGNAWHWSWPLPAKWFLPLCAGILGCLPWLLMIFGVNWGRVLSGAAKTFSESRHENGSALVWVSLVIALCLALFIPAFHASAVAIACLVCVLLGKAAIRLGPAGDRFFCLLAAICLILAGIILLCLSFRATQSLILGFLPELPLPDPGNMLLSLHYLPVVGGIILLGGIIALMFVRRFGGCGPLIYGILLVIIICQPCRLGLVHELASMPNTPLVSFATAEAQVADALAPPVPKEAEPVIPQAPEAPAPDSPESGAASPLPESNAVTPDQGQEAAPQLPQGEATPPDQQPEGLEQQPPLPAEPDGPVEIIVIPEAPASETPAPEIPAPAPQTEPDAQTPQDLPR